MAEPSASDPKLTFEQAISRVEEIASAMESGSLPLEEMITQYETGTRLVHICRQRIAEARQKVTLISQRADGSFTQEAFASDEAPTATQGSSRVQSKPSRSRSGRSKASNDCDELNDEVIPF